MEAQLSDPQLASRDTIDNAVFCGDAPRPVAAQGVLERLGLTDPAIRIARNVPDELVNALHHLGIGLLPVEIFLPRLRREDEIHASSFSFLRTPLPRSSAAIEFKSRFAFAGERNR